LSGKNVGMDAIKQRRLSLAVNCHPGTYVGEYVPFYFCPRSVMLYLLHRGNHPDLTYREGQGEIVHLMAPLDAALEYAHANGIKWAFSPTNAGACYTRFYADVSDLDQISWEAVRARDFRDSEIKEGKQAEFLFHEFFPWSLVVGIGVQGQGVYDKVESMLEGADHRPAVKIKSNWYF